MGKKIIRKKLTDEEYNAVSRLTANTKLDSCFDIYGVDAETDKWYDYEEDRKVALSTGFKWLADGLAYPLAHDGLDPKESLLVVNLLKEFAGISDDAVNFLLRVDEEDK